MQSELDFFEENKTLGEQVRDMNYRQAQESVSIVVQRDRVRNMLLEHPEGVTDTEICAETGIERITSITARRHEIKGMIAVTIARVVDEDGDRINTMWSVKLENV